jgi:hypothetical protein
MIQLVLGILCSFFGHILIYIHEDTFYTITPSFTSIQSLANHPIGGIFLAFIGFVLLFYLIFTTARVLRSYWSNLKTFLRIFTIGWFILLCISTIYHAITLYHILGYIFIFTVIILFFFLMLNYFEEDA